MTRQALGQARHPAEVKVKPLPAVRGYSLVINGKQFFLSDQALRDAPEAAN